MTDQTPETPAAPETPAPAPETAPEKPAPETKQETAQEGIDSVLKQAQQEKKAAPKEGTEPNAESEQPDPETQPITDWSKVDLGLAKDAPVDEALLASFGEAAVKMGLTPAQAKAAINWQLEAIKEAQEAYADEQFAALKKAWGKKMAACGTKVNELVTRIDGKVAGFSEAFAKSGAANSALVLQGLLAIATMLEEDGLGAGASGGGSEKQETAEEGILAAYANGGQG